MATDVYIGDGGTGTVRMYGCITREWDQEAEYDPSGTDIIRQKVKLSVEGTVHLTNASFSGFDAGTRTFTAISPGDANVLPTPTKIAILRGLLLTPRKPISVYHNGTLALYAAPLGGTTAIRSDWLDIDNGPKPRGANITRIVGDNTFRLIFSVEMNLIRCINGSPISGIGAFPVVSNRWSVSEAMDRDFFTRRTIRGAMRLSTSNWPAHAYKAFCVPALEDGFARESIEFEAAENGLDATYQVTDVQVHTAAPWPATQMEATNTEETLDGVNFMSTMNVRLKGAPASPKDALIAAAVNVADSRLNYFNGGSADKALVVNFSLIEHIGAENTVDLSMTLKRFDENIGTYVANLMGNTLGKPLNLPQLAGQPNAYDPEKSIVPALWGYNPGEGDRSPAVLFLMSCYLQDPCSDQKMIYQGQQGTGNPPSQQSPQDRTQTQVTQVPPGTLNGGNFQNYSQQQKTAIYTFARMQSRYTVDSKAVSLAIADSDTVDDDTAVIVKLSKGRCCRTISYDAERVGQQPEIPAPADTYTDGNIKGTLLKHWLEIHPATLSADGVKRVYRVTAFYRYGLNRPPKTTEAMRVGVLPFTSFAQADNAYVLQDGINAGIGP